MFLEFDMENVNQLLAPLAGLPKEMGAALHQSMKRTGTHVLSNVSKGIKAESYLKAGDIRKALNKPLVKVSGDYASVEVKVASRQLAADHFRLVPRRVTARKGMKSINWPVAGYKIGPREPVRSDSGKGRQFVTRFKKGDRLFLMRRGPGKKVKSTLHRVEGVSVQYFAAFNTVEKKVLADARNFFTKTLLHEVQYRLGKLR